MIFAEKSSRPEDRRFLRLHKQMNSCSCLTLLLACVVYWQAKEISRVLKMGIPEGEDIDISLLEHVSPIEWENVILYAYVLNPDEEQQYISRAQLGGDAVVFCVMASHLLPAKRRWARTKAAIELTNKVNATVTRAMKAELPSICQKRPLIAIDT
jgi:hypothetical protein